MKISLNWLRDFVDLPADLSPRELVDRFTITCAEVEGVEAIDVAAEGLICARVTSLSAATPDGAASQNWCASSASTGSGSAACNRASASPRRRCRRIRRGVESSEASVWRTSACSKS